MAVNIVFITGEIPDGIKTGLLTPIYKNKGERNNSKNYRGITVLPVIGKLLAQLTKNVSGTFGFGCMEVWSNLTLLERNAYVRHW